MRQRLCQALAGRTSADFNPICHTASNTSSPAEHINMWESRFNNLDKVLTYLKTKKMDISKTQIVKDPGNKKLLVTRHFDAPLEKVWSAWTEAELLDQWWAPRPWRAETKSMNFTVGGHWLYSMVGPENERHWSKVEFKSIDNLKSFETGDYFCDENGIRNSDMPGMEWKNNFTGLDNGTKVEVELSFATQEDLEAILAMGFEAGFSSALFNLDELLAK